MSAPTLQNQNTIAGIDATLFSVASILATDGSVSVSPNSFLASFKKADLTLNREFMSVKSSNQTAPSSRCIGWAEGSVTVSGFVRGTSDYAAIYATGSHGLLSFTEGATGDKYQVLVQLKEFKKSIGEKDTDDSLTMPTEGAPFYALTGGSLAALPFA